MYTKVDAEVDSAGGRVSTNGGDVSHRAKRVSIGRRKSRLLGPALPCNKLLFLGKSLLAFRDLVPYL